MNPRRFPLETVVHADPHEVQPEVLPIIGTADLCVPSPLAALQRPIAATLRAVGQRIRRHRASNPPSPCLATFPQDVCPAPDLSGPQEALSFHNTDSGQRSASEGFTARMSSSECTNPIT